MSFTPFRNIPSVNELLEAAPLRGLLGRLHPAAVASTVRAVLDEVRNEVQNAASERALPSITELADRVARRLAETHPATARPFINATGVLLHPLWTPPLADEAIDAIAGIARSFSAADTTLSISEREPSEGEAEMLLQELTGSETGRVLHNEAGAIAVLAAALAGGREVIVARCDMGEIAPGVCIADLLAAGQGTVCGVGSVRGATLQDYLDAIGDSTAAIVVAQARDYSVCGALPQVSLAELAKAAHAHGIPVIHCVGSAASVDTSDLVLPQVQRLKQSLQEGADLVIAPGGELFGGPPCGILVGRRTLIERLDWHPLTAALRPNAITLAAMNATLRLFRQPEKAGAATPLLQLLQTSVANLKNRAERLAPQLAACPSVAKAEARESVAYLYPSKASSCQIPSWSVIVDPGALGTEPLDAALRAKAPFLWVERNQGQVVIDLRGVIPRQDQEIVAAFQAMNEQHLC